MWSKPAHFHKAQNIFASKNRATLAKFRGDTSLTKPTTNLGFSHLARKVASRPSLVEDYRSNWMTLQRSASSSDGETRSLASWKPPRNFDEQIPKNDGSLGRCSQRASKHGVILGINSFWFHGGQPLIIHYYHVEDWTASNRLGKLIT